MPQINTDPEVMDLTETLDKMHSEVIDQNLVTDPEVMDLTETLIGLGIDVSASKEFKKARDLAILTNSGFEPDPEIKKRKAGHTRLLESFMGAGELGGRFLLAELAGGVEIAARGVTGLAGLLAGTVKGGIDAASSVFNPNVSAGDAFIGSQKKVQDAFSLPHIPLNPDDPSIFAGGQIFAEGAEKATMQLLVEPFQAAGATAGQSTLEATGSPALATGVDTLFQLLPIAAGGFAGRGRPTPEKHPLQRETGAEITPQTLREKTLIDKANSPIKLPEDNPIAQQDLKIIEQLDKGTERASNLEQLIANATTEIEKANFTNELLKVNISNKMLAGQLTKNKIKEMQENMGLPSEIKPTNKMPDFEITAPDKRTGDMLKKDLFTVTTKLHSNGTPAAVFKQNFPDINKFQAQVQGRITTNFATAEKHPLAKWTRDKMKVHINRANNLADELLNAPVFEKGLGLTALRQAKKVGTDAGALTIFARTKLDDQVKMLDTMLEFDSLERLPTKVELLSKGLTTEQISSVHTIRATLDTTRDFVNQAITKWGPEDMDLLDNIPGYLPHIWFGEGRVWVRDSANNLVDVLPTSGKFTARSLASKIQKKNPDLKITSSIRTGSDSDPAIAVFSDAMMFLQSKNNHKLTQQVRELFEKNLGTAGFLKFTKTRTGVGGFAGAKVEIPGAIRSNKQRVQEFQKGLTAYINGAARFAENLRAKKEFNQIFTDPAIKEAYPNAMHWSQLLVDEMFGVRKGLADPKFMDGLVGDWFGRTGLTRAFEGISNVTSIMTLFAFNTKFLALQGLQPYQMMGGALMQQKSLGMKSSAIRAIAEGHRAFFKPNKEEVEAIQFSIKNGAISPKFVEATMGDNFFNNGILTKKEKWIDALTGRDAVSKMEVWARTLENLIFYKHQRNSGESHQGAMEKASGLVNKHLVEYKNTEAPIILGKSSPLGAAAIPARLFKSFQFNMYAQMGSFLRTARDKKDIKPLVAFLGSQAIVGGAMGFFGVKEVDALINGLNGINPTFNMPNLTETMLSNGYSDLLIYGPISAGLDFDISSSASAPGILPKNIFFLPGLEWSEEAIGSVGSWFTMQSQGLATESDTMLMLKTILPKSLHGFIEEAYTGDNPDSPTPIPAFGNRGFLIRSDQEKLKRMLTGFSLRERRLMDTLWSFTIMNKRAKLNDKTLIEAAAQSLVKFGGIPQFLQRKLLDSGMTGTQISNSIKNLIQDQKTTVLQWGSDFGKTKKGRQQWLNLKRSGNLEVE